jgi:23S rRNA (pseudouridine1915-N3)-methyltransferase
MKVSILCEGRLNKGIENDLCKLYLDRILSLKNSGILNIEIKKISEKKEINKNKNIKNIILDENGENLTTLSLSKKLVN